MDGWMDGDTMVTIMDDFKMTIGQQKQFGLRIS